MPPPPSLLDDPIRMSPYRGKNDYLGETRGYFFDEPTNCGEVYLGLGMLGVFIVSIAIVVLILIRRL